MLPYDIPAADAAMPRRSAILFTLDADAMIFRRYATLIRRRYCRRYAIRYHAAYVTLIFFAAMLLLIFARYAMPARFDFGHACRRH